MGECTAGNVSYGTVDYQIDCVARGLMFSQLIFRAERQQKIPKKGHKLLKFPKRLEPHPVREYTHGRPFCRLQLSSEGSKKPQG